jgi:hypothetical protein
MPTPQKTLRRSASKSKPTSARSRGDRRKPNDSRILLITKKKIYEIPRGAIDTLNPYWDYVFRHRHRWVGSDAWIHELGDRALEAVKGWNIGDYVKEIAKAGLVEVRIPHNADKSVLALPWEFLLQLVTRKRDLVVIRHLYIPDALRDPVRRPPPQEISVPSKRSG